MSISCMESLVVVALQEFLPITHGIVLTFDPLGRHQLLIALNATSPICLFTITEKIK